jgi:hypothetical protein
LERYICIHGHFYQPPRENPTLEAIEGQESAYPYHDWNERISAECYAPNTGARILNCEGQIVKIANNYARMSFDIGPTLLAWLEANQPEVYGAILAADFESRRRFSGHGSALAQAYNHVIMPLLKGRDKETQVRWGIRDFEHRFGRAPEGMWLPETAVDLETLDIMAAHGIRFTILAQHQAARERRIGDHLIREVYGGRIDPSTAYALRLPSGRTINVFFYDSWISGAVAFENILDRGTHFANRLLMGFSAARTWPQLVHIATEGETYGYHHRHGEIALAYALERIESQGLARLTNYGEYLDRFPPTHEVELIEYTSWSCPHGVERWRDDCGCHSGRHSGWNQLWRAPLREALDWLRDTLAPRYEDYAGQLLNDSWAARDDYIEVLLDRSPENLAAFLARHAARDLDNGERVTALKLLEMQRHAQLMYTSSGWHFDDISGAEAVQSMQYAGHALRLARDLFDEDLEPDFLARLELAQSNLPEHQNGRAVYERQIRPALADLPRIAAHYAVASLFDHAEEQTQMYCYTIDREDYRLLRAGRARLALGRARITSNITRESLRVSFGVLHLDGYDIRGGIRTFRGEQAYAALVDELAAAFEAADLSELGRLVDKHFGAGTYSLKLLLGDEQRRVLNRILKANLAEAEEVYRRLYEQHAPLLRFVCELTMPPPNGLRMAAELTLNADLRRALTAGDLDLDRIAALLDEARGVGIVLDTAGLGYMFQQAIVRLAERLRVRPEDRTQLRMLEQAVALARTAPLDVNLWKAQSIYAELVWTVEPAMRVRAVQDDEAAQVWIDRFTALGEQLGFCVEMRR